MPEALFRFTVQHVFYVPPPVDDGSVREGDSLTVRCRTGEASVVVEAIEMLGADIPSVAKGQQVGLRLRGIGKDQVRAGDQVTGGRVHSD